MLKNTNLLNDTHKQNLLHEVAQIELTIKHYIDVSNCNCNQHQDK